MVKLTLKPRCTCGSTDDKHYLRCDLFYTEGKSRPRKHKRFGIFYPLKERKS